MNPAGDWRAPPPRCPHDRTFPSCCPACVTRHPSPVQPTPTSSPPSLPLPSSRLTRPPPITLTLAQSEHTLAHLQQLVCSCVPQLPGPPPPPSPLSSPLRPPRDTLRAALRRYAPRCSAPLSSGLPALHTQPSRDHPAFPYRQPFPFLSPFFPSALLHRSVTQFCPLQAANSPLSPN